MAQKAQAMAAIYPDNAIGRKAWGIALKKMGRDEEALQPMQKTALLSPGDAEAHINLGSTLLTAGRPVEAKASCGHVC